jgi:hypothetical protein
MTNLILAAITNVLMVTNSTNDLSLLAGLACYTTNVPRVMTTGTNGSVSASRLAEIRLQEGGRMTGLVETVCVVTNETTTDNGKAGCPYWQGGCLVIGCQQGRPEPATEKTATTEVVEIKTLSFSWDGKAYAERRERVLSRKVRRWKREDAWAEVVEPERK